MFIINHIVLLLCDKDPRSYSYYIEVSLNQEDWCRVIDHSTCLCRSVQKLYFGPRVVRYLGSGYIVVQLPQPYMVDSMRLLLWDCDARSYSYYVEISVDKKKWTRIADRIRTSSRSICQVRRHAQHRQRGVSLRPLRVSYTSADAGKMLHALRFC
ncbi:btb poz domain-containing protein 9-like [Tropilaelaps mercedesae]|uniref:Btb poz domain-containing protein 9-like n=1 Tax=Tropilaelaps mercedesae TaxID=418985 RepID=A0A1V9XID9_9ACAR|nr:btb poz domain-containing protein 9-like [Tropilaelaps mercedesae]